MTARLSTTNFDHPSTRCSARHIAISSPDPGALAQWYVDHLGFYINHAYMGNFFVKAPNGVILEFIPSKGEPRAEQAMTTPGLRHMAVSVEDFDAAREHLRSIGVKLVGEPFMVGDNRLAYFADADGNLLHLIKRKTPLP